MLRLLLALVLVFVVGFGGCVLYGVSRDEPAAFVPERAKGISLSAPTPLVPGPGLPADLVLGASNNNLDVVRHQGRFFLGVRTAPHHFASDEARLLVLSSPDRQHWTLETVFDLDERDLREPRFLSIDSRLLFYFFEAADAATGFVPIAMRVAERRADGSWSESRPILEPGLVPWRAKVRNGRAWLCAYQGRKLYDDLGAAGATRLFVSDDGLSWESVSGEASPIDFPGTSECAFEIDPTGNLVALVRVEARGALVCTAPANRLERWDCTPTPYRHDSPILFRDGDRTFAIARRSLGGPIQRDFAPIPEPAATWLEQLRYWITRKRTTLYEVLPEERRTAPLLDFPSRGDTAFAGIVPLAGGRYWVANYSSDLNGPDWPWVGGQLTGSRICGFELLMPQAAEAATQDDGFREP